MQTSEARRCVCWIARHAALGIAGLFGFQEKPDLNRALISAATIAGAYIGGGFIPVSPYIFIPAASTALAVSIVVLLIARAIFGYING